MLVGLTLGTTGMHLIRMSELKKKAGHDKECCFYYFCGMFMNILLGPLLDVAGYAFAPAALIAPLTGINIIINSVVAPYTLGEELTPRRLFSASVVFVAATSSIAFKHLSGDRLANSHWFHPEIPGFSKRCFENNSIRIVDIFHKTECFMESPSSTIFYPRHLDL